MYMAYTTNPHIPKVRQQAVQLVYQGWSRRKVARHFGVEHSTVVRWVQQDTHWGRIPIPTLSSRPHSHPAALSESVV